MKIVANIMAMNEWPRSVVREWAHISPHWEIITGILGLLLGPVGTFSILRITNRPSIIRPDEPIKDIGY